jgi:phosphoribosyl 1,2-cyclic phosphodiesterase
MPLYIASLNSGSNGNCYYIGNETEAVLVDAGISCRETEIRMKRLGLNMGKVKAIFISHEHKDHITGLSVLAKKYQLPVYITEYTQKNSKVGLEKKLVCRFKANESIQVGALNITAFKKCHDAEDPHSFIVASSSTKIGVFTDIGNVCDEVVRHFKQCHAVFLEANYDEEMLHNGGYPYYLKKRITDGNGHLSNIQALDLFCKHRPSFMSHLILSHLSKHNNDPALVKTLFDEHAGNTTIIIASRYEETPIYHITGEEKTFIRSERPKNKKVHQQLSLF